MKKPMYFEGIVAILLILLCFTMYLMLTGNTITSSQWQVAGSGPIASVQIGSDGTLYAFAQDSGNDIYAIDSHGNVKWNYRVTDQWCVSATRFIRAGDGIQSIDSPVFASDNGTLYLYIRQNDTHSHNFKSIYDIFAGSTPDGSPLSSEVMAISPEGTPLWTAVVGDYYWSICDVSVHVKNGRICAFTGYNLTVLDASGKPLFMLDNVSDPPAVDDSGYLYVSRSGPSYMFQESQSIRDPSGIIEAYYPNGTLYWSRTMNVPISRPGLTGSIGQKYGYLPLYQNDTLYVPVSNGIIAMYTNGSVKWSKDFYGGVYQLYQALPIDAHGNIYLQYHKPPPPPMMGPDADTYTPFLKVIDSDGNVIIDREPYPGGVADPLNDYIYGQDGDMLAYPSLRPGLYNLVTCRITAYDMLNNRTVWQFTIPLGQTRQVILDADNARTIFHPATAELLIHDNQDIANSSFKGLRQTFVSWPQLKILAGNDVLYVSYLTSNIQVPPVFGKARCVYTNSIYALDKNGTLLWSKPVDSFVTSMAANNSTIFYGMSNGAISAGQSSSIAEGVAIVAILYVFVKFFMAGSVTRARKLLDKNENRNAVYGFILRHPGSTLYDISRTLGMNIGTVRYHLFILGMNHRIVTYHTGVKYVRYFTNSGSYSMEEQSIISLVRRDVMHKILGLLIERPGLSNMQISQALDIPESAVSKYMKELSSRGIVMKSPKGSYSIKTEHQKLITNALKHMRMND